MIMNNLIVLRMLWLIFMIKFFLYRGVLVRGAGSVVRQVGFLCGDSLITDIDDEILKLVYNISKKRFVNISKLSDDVAGTCREVVVDVDQLYSAKYYPRIYYTIYKLEFGGEIGYLLERYNGTMASSRFYPCSNVKECGDLIEAFESL